MIVLHPDLLLLQGVTLGALLSIVTAAGGLVCMAVSFEGWLLKKASLWERIMLFICGALLIAPQLYLGAIGAGLFILVILWQKFGLEQAT